MSPEILLAKLKLLQQVLLDLRPHVDASREEQTKSHYEIERQIQLAVDLSVTLARRILILRGVPLPETARDVFLELRGQGVIDGPLADRLAGTVGLRNLLVHEYGTIDYDRFFDGLKDGHTAFVRFSTVLATVSIT